MTSAYDEPQHHVVPYRVYFNIWIGLLILTSLTVGASYIDFGHVGMLTALLIATVKASLVLLYFMHIRFEKPLYIYMILAVLITYGVLIGLTFSDYLYR